MHYARAFDVSSTRSDGILRFQNMEQYIGQAPYTSESVFNFYLPDYQSPGDVTGREVYSPEFQVYDDSTALLGANVFYKMAKIGLVYPFDTGRRSYGNFNYDYEISLAGDLYALIDHLDILLCRGQLTETSRNIIIEACSEIPSGSAEERVERALALITITPEFNVLQ